MSVYTKLSDEELLGRFNQGDPSAFDEIYKRHWDGMYQSAYRILKEHDGCMDVLQEIFMWIWKKQGLLVIGNLRSYLYAAVKFKIANYIRNGKIRNSFFDEIGDIEEPYISPENNFEVKELQRVIIDFTQTLPVKCRQVFLLSRQEHLSNKQIAAQLGISVKTVENQMTAALKKLRLSLARMFYFLFFFL